jgi:periplasmic divalent cation tolerance protein
MKVKNKNLRRNKNKYLLVITAAEKREDAERIINVLLNEKLVACAQTFRIKSFYWWNKKIQKSKEYLILLKTISTNYKKVEKRIKKNHDYEIPEIIAIEIRKGSKDYLQWIDSVLSLKNKN